VRCNFIVGLALVFDLVTGFQKAIAFRLGVFFLVGQTAGSKDIGGFREFNPSATFL
jgi:hypothetical protein